ncbi:hypothetical protein VTN00DRAFT_3056 [Thermoascus crustaceus]|uniref:uncharacterized protein n=1 Tax=Thermoascus crustaceus TaxID=5088 RepID=UPI003743B881
MGSAGLQQASRFLPQRWYGVEASPAGMEQDDSIPVDGGRDEAQPGYMPSAPIGFAAGHDPSFWHGYSRGLPVKIRQRNTEHLWTENVWPRRGRRLCHIKERRTSAQGLAQDTECPRKVGSGRPLSPQVPQYQQETIGHSP